MPIELETKVRKGGVCDDKELRPRNADSHEVSGRVTFREELITSKVRASLRVGNITPRRENNITVHSTTLQRELKKLKEGEAILNFAKIRDEIASREFGKATTINLGCLLQSIAGLLFCLSFVFSFRGLFCADKRLWKSVVVCVFHDFLQKLYIFFPLSSNCGPRWAACLHASDGERNQYKNVEPGFGTSLKTKPKPSDLPTTKQRKAIAIFLFVVNCDLLISTYNC